MFTVPATLTSQTVDQPDGSVGQGPQQLPHHAHPVVAAHSWLTTGPTSTWVVPTSRGDLRSGKK